jgi:hypothetical protein
MTLTIALRLLHEVEALQHVDSRVDSRKIFIPKNRNFFYRIKRLAGEYEFGRARVIRRVLKVFAGARIQRSPSIRFAIRSAF